MTIRQITPVELFTLFLMSTVLICGCESETSIESVVDLKVDPEHKVANVIVAERMLKIASDLEQPVRMEAAGKPIDIAKLSKYGHAGPCIADVDCDGDKDLLVGDFPGNFWVFLNEYSDGAPKYAAGVKLQAGGVDAKVPIY